MPGLDRSHASEALKLGWPRRLLLDIHSTLIEHNLDSFSVSDIGIYTGRPGTNRHFAFYRHYPIENTLASIRTFNGISIQQPSRSYTAYTDGSGTSPDKPSGIGVVIIEQDTSGNVLSKMEIAESSGNGTNNHAELSAVMRVFYAIPCLSATIMIRPDSMYAIGCASDFSWKIKSNQELVARIRREIYERNQFPGHVTFSHVKGHSGHPENELADRLANRGRLISR